MRFASEGSPRSRGRCVRPASAPAIAFTRDRLAHYKCPTSVFVIPALPRNPTGKVLKRQLRASLFLTPAWPAWR